MTTSASTSTLNTPTIVIEYEKPPTDIDVLTTEEKKELMTADSISITSSTTPGAAELAFAPAKSLYVNTKGIAALRLPTPPAELEITIHNPDGSLAYNSIRAKRSSGNCVLTDSDGKALIATEYFFGPSKDPVLHRLELDENIASNIRTVSKWTSRNHTFLLPDGRTCKWTYKKERGFGAKGTKGTALVLTLGDKRMAVLIRNDETRTSGSKSCSAGNGGELVLGKDVGGKDGIEEDLVVATCLLMLKKEIDRRRTVQFMLIASAVS
jgi:hypothetical protein